jgi:hypothetical protein
MDKQTEKQTPKDRGPRVKQGSLGWALFGDEIMGPDPIDGKDKPLPRLRVKQANKEK